MRGAERPSEIPWTRPFLPPLGPLTNEAAQQTFIDVADNVHDIHDVEKLLFLTDNLPLAVDIIAHLVDYQGASIVLSQWERKKTSLLSVGHDRGSNLDISIELSLSSPRMLSSPGAKKLLSILSVLPDGLSDLELKQSHISIQDILTCKAVLLRTSLAYVTQGHRLKVLVPIREYVAKIYPPTQSHLHALSQYFHQLLKLYARQSGHMAGATVMQRVTSNLGNLRNILMFGLSPDNPDKEETIESAIVLNDFSRLTGHGCSDVMNKIPDILAMIQDSELQAKFITQIMTSWLVDQTLGEPEFLINEGKKQFVNLHNTALECEFYFFRIYQNLT